MRQVQNALRNIGIPVMADVNQFTPYLVWSISEYSLYRR